MFQQLRKKSMSLVAALLAMFCVSIVLAGCGGSATPEEVAKKAEAVQVKMIELGKSNPQKLLEITQEMQTKVPDLQKADDLNALDKFYDELLDKMK